MRKAASYLAMMALAATVATAVPDRVLAAGDKALGEYLASECVTCHQMTGQYAGIPPIVGWPDSSFIAIMNEYRHKTRSNPIMVTIAGRLSADEIAALAAYFGSLPVQPQSKETKSTNQ
jgi:cytochrome c553